MKKLAYFLSLILFVTVVSFSNSKVDYFSPKTSTYASYDDLKLLDEDGRNGISVTWTTTKKGNRSFSISIRFKKNKK